MDDQRQPFPAYDAPVPGFVPAPAAPGIPPQPPQPQTAPQQAARPPYPPYPPYGVPPQGYVPAQQPMPQPAPQPIPQPMPQPMPQSAPQPAPQPIPQPAPQPMPQPAPQPAPQPNFGQADFAGPDLQQTDFIQPDFTEPDLVQPDTQQRTYPQPEFPPQDYPQPDVQQAVFPGPEAQAPQNRQIPQAGYYGAPGPVQPNGEPYQQPDRFVPAYMPAQPVQKPKKKKTGLIAGVLVGVLVLAGLGTFLGIYLTKDARQYKKAEQALDAGDYDAAYSMFRDLGDYENAEEMMKEVRYRQGQVAFDQQDYDKALAILTDLGDYRDCRDLCLEIRYQQALDSMSRGDYQQAYEGFFALDGYRDSEDKMAEIRYDTAMAAYANEEYLLAYLTLSELAALNDSTDAAAQLDDLVWEWANAVLEGDADPDEFAENAELTEDQALSVYNLVIDCINGNIDAPLSDWRNIYAPRALAVSSVLPESVGRTKSIRQVFNWMTDQTQPDWSFYSGTKEGFAELLSTDWIYYLMQEENVILGFLAGNWSTSDDAYYFNVTKDAVNDTFHTEYNIPWPEKPENTKFFCLRDYTYSYSDENNEPLLDVYDITVIDENTIEIYAYEDDNDYRLTRK